MELALNCEEYRALPYAGGVMDQPAGLIKKMRQVRNVYEAFMIYKKEANKPGEAAKWKSEHTEIVEIVNHINKLREMYD